MPSRCDLGESFCEATCNSIGRTGGKCVDDGNDCQCDDTYLSPSQFALCAAESTCRLDCQRQGYVLMRMVFRYLLTFHVNFRLATGECFGWKCQCRSENNAPLPAEFEELKNN